MNEFSILFKEIEVADCYFEHEVSLIPLYEDYFTEAGDSEGFFGKLKKAVCDFVDKIVSTIKTVFEKFTSGKACKKAEDAIAKNPDLKNEKTKIKDWKKVHVLNKETQKKIQNAKSPEEVDKIMKEYKAKRNKILAIGATVTVTIGGILLFLKKGKSKTVSTMEDQKKGMDYGKGVESNPKPVTTNSPKPSTPAKPSVVNEPAKTLEVKKATADAEIRKTEAKDTADQVKECVKEVTSSPLISDDVAAALKNKMNGSAISNDDDIIVRRKEAQSNVKSKIKESKNFIKWANNSTEESRKKTYGLGNDYMNTSKKQLISDLEEMLKDDSIKHDKEIVRNISTTIKELKAQQF